MALPNVSLSAPWYMFYNKLLFTIGQSPCIQVGQLIPLPTGSFTLPITVTSSLIQAEALRQIIPETISFGGVDVMTQIFFNTQFVPTPTTTPTTAEELATLFCTALSGNPLFIGAVLLDGKILPPQASTLGNVSLVICPAIIQFYADDLSTLCQNFIGIAADVFAEILITSFGTQPLKASFSTYYCECTLQKDLFCRNMCL